MTPSELSTRSALQIFLERAHFALRFERNSGFDLPRPVLRGVRTIASVVFEQALFKITCNASVMNRWVCPTHHNINVNEVFQLAGLPSRSLWSALESQNSPPASTLLRRGSPESFRGWARQDSNLQ